MKMQCYKPVTNLQSTCNACQARSGLDRSVVKRTDPLSGVGECQRLTLKVSLGGASMTVPRVWFLGSRALTLPVRHMGLPGQGVVHTPGRA